MDNFDHSDPNSLAEISAAHDTALKLFQIKPTSNIRELLKSKMNVKGISSISLPCQDITEFSTNKVINIPKNLDVSDKLLSLENVNDKYKGNIVINVLKNNNLIPGVG